MAISQIDDDENDKNGDSSSSKDVMVKYYDMRGNVVCEPRGILGLSSLNGMDDDKNGDKNGDENDDKIDENNSTKSDEDDRRVTRDDVIRYVIDLVESERGKRHSDEQVHDLDSGISTTLSQLSSSLSSFLASLNDVKIGEKGEGEIDEIKNDDKNDENGENEKSNDGDRAVLLTSVELRSSVPPQWAHLSLETQQYWNSVVQLLSSSDSSPLSPSSPSLSSSSASSSLVSHKNDDALFSQYNQVRKLWSTFKAEQQQIVVSELQSMVGECLLLYSTLINLLLKFAILRTTSSRQMINGNSSSSSSSSSIPSSGSASSLVVEFGELIQQLNQEPNSTAQNNLLCLSYFSRAIAHCVNQQYEESIQDYTKAIALNESSVVYNNRGMSYYSLKKMGEAMRDFNVAIKMKSDYAMPYYNRSLVHEAQDRIFEAQQDAKRAYLLHSSNKDFQSRYKTLRNIIESML